MAPEPGSSDPVLSNAGPWAHGTTSRCWHPNHLGSFFSLKYQCLPLPLVGYSDSQDISYSSELGWG